MFLEMTAFSTEKMPNISTIPVCVRCFVVFTPCPRGVVDQFQVNMKVIKPHFGLGLGLGLGWRVGLGSEGEAWKVLK